MDPGGHADPSGYGAGRGVPGGRAARDRSPRWTPHARDGEDAEGGPTEPVRTSRPRQAPSRHPDPYPRTSGTAESRGVESSAGHPPVGADPAGPRGADDTATHPRTVARPGSGGSRPAKSAGAAGQVSRSEQIAPADLTDQVSPKGPASGAARPHRRRGQRTALVAWLRREAVFAAVLLGVGGGFLLISQNRWRRGLLLIGATLVLAGLTRLAVPTRRMGLLAVRGRVFDTLLLLALGAAVIALTTAVPYPAPAP
ncbi:membrane hypothetical protein [Frankia sp. AiPs1]|uniref:DUF3017 domain-containing protein n=1 Tax=Frankia sp. AiPa1 TaxID=573492 RepID=UPI00202AEBD7|nr:DUF3017 domain-containing protein [Frankia sp. AiPa1]MCL9757740.1 DUF3017 domain-containing protein [Frankia sp. AiPa1]